MGEIPDIPADIMRKAEGIAATMLVDPDEDYSLTIAMAILAERRATEIRLVREGKAVGFLNEGNVEAEWIAAAENACPHCGGSGHKDDVSAPSCPDHKNTELRNEA